jgi:hypothetical protein
MAPGATGAAPETAAGADDAAALEPVFAAPPLDVSLTGPLDEDDEDDEPPQALNSKTSDKNTTAKCGNCPRPNQRDRLVECIIRLRYFKPIHIKPTPIPTPITTDPNEEAFTRGARTKRSQDR